ncbi:MAG: S8 family peptidase [Pseudoflavonifractor sp.]|nr:S8 family peptidase [Alloprevotella sp.]MCM1116678.1 S8 family peptidase [Pseudoflavonifractor sp.]
MNIRNRLILTAAAIVITAMGSVAQTTLSPAACRALARHEAATASRSAEDNDEDSHTLATIELSSPSALDSLIAIGAEVKATFGTFAIVTLPYSQARRAARLGGIRAIDFGSEARPLLDEARKPTGVNDVHAGLALPQAFTGKDVVVGIVDVGFDPLHPAFTQGDTVTRVKLFASISKGGKIKTYTTVEEMRRAMTDSKSETHATHVSGIAAGGHVDKAMVPILSEPNAQGKVTITSISERPLPYYGVAPDADIVMAGGSLDLSSILLGVNTIIDYAASVGKPAVVNMSLGMGLGPHNGEGLFSRAIAELGKDAIIAVAAGNEGDRNISINHVIGSSGQMTTGVDLSDAKASDPSEQAIELYSTEPMTVYLSGYDKTTGERVFKVKAQPFTSSGECVSMSLAMLGKYAQYFGGKPEMGIGENAEGDPENTYTYISLDGVYPMTSNTGVVLAIEALAPEGTRILAFANNGDNPFFTAGIKSFEGGSPDMSISDLATGQNIISVGAFNTRDSWPALDKGFYGYKNTSFPYLQPSGYSSYGTLLDGRTLPHVSAPGTVLVSALNRYYTKGEKTDKYSARVKASNLLGMDAYYGHMLGTSMATPFMTGVIALWLEANPDLTIDDILDIVAETSIKDETYDKGGVNAIRLGAGRVDALAGIKKALALGGKNGIADVSLSAPDGLISFDSSSASAIIPGAKEVTISIFTTSGSLAATATVPGQEAILDLSHLTPGIYIIKASAPGLSNPLTKKVAIN